MRPSVAEEEPVAIEGDVLQDEQDQSKPLPAGMRYEHGKVVPHLSSKSASLGARRPAREVPRSSHADFTPGALRPDPVELLESQAVTRVPELVPIRYGRMLVSPFTFYRGAALIMAARPGRHTPLGAHDPGLRRRPPDELRRVRLAGAPAGVRHQRLRRDLPGAVGVGRQAAAASFAIAGRDNGFTTKERTEGAAQPARRVPHRPCASSRP